MHESASLPAPPGNHVEEDGLEGVTGTAEALPCPSAFSIPVHVPDTWVEQLGGGLIFAYQAAPSSEPESPVTPDTKEGQGSSCSFTLGVSEGFCSSQAQI